MKAHILKLPIVLSALGLAAHAHAALYDITFSGDGYAANGQIGVVGGLADSGYLTVTSGNDLGTYYLTTGASSVRVGGGTDLIYDDEVSPNSSPFLDGSGLAFVASSNVGNSPGFGLWWGDADGNPDGFYSLFDASDGNYVDAQGTANIVAVPEAAGTTKLAGFSALGLFGLVTWRRQFAKMA